MPAMQPEYAPAGRRDRGAELGLSGDYDHGAACVPRQPAWYRARHVMPEMRGCPDHERVRAEFGGHYGEFPGRVPWPGAYVYVEPGRISHLVQFGA